MLLICEPLPFVNSPCHVTEFSKAVCFAKNPIPVVNLTSYVNEYTFAVSLPKVPMSVINCAIMELNFALAVPKPAKPLAFIAGHTNLVSVLSKLQPWLACIVQVTTLVLGFKS